jgi:rubrerythrin
MKLDEAIRAALEYEAGVHRTYREALDRTKDEAGRRIFQTLCDEEMSHLNYLRERLEEWGTTGKIWVKKIETSIPTRAAIDESLQNLRMRLAPQASDKHTLELELLRKALDVESRTGDFYRELVGKLEGDGRKLFARFVEIEEGHQAIVQAEISSLSGFGVWFDSADFKPDGS